MADKPYVLQALQNIDTNMEKNKDEIVKKIQAVSDKLGLHGNTDYVSVFGKLNRILTTMGVDISGPSGDQTSNIYEMIQQIITNIGGENGDNKETINDQLDKIFKRLYRLDITPTINYESTNHKYEKDKKFPTSDDDTSLSKEFYSLYSLLAHVSEKQLGFPGTGKDSLNWYIAYLKDHQSEIEKSVVMDESNKVTDPNAPKPLWQIINTGLQNITTNINSLTDTSNSSSIVNNIKGSVGSPLLDRILIKTYHGYRKNNSGYYNVYEDSTDYTQSVTLYGPGVFKLQLFSTFAQYNLTYIHLIDIEVDGKHIYPVKFNAINDSKYTNNNNVLKVTNDGYYSLQYLTTNSVIYNLNNSGLFFDPASITNAAGDSAKNSNATTYTNETMINFTDTVKITIHSNIQKSNVGNFTYDKIYEALSEFYSYGGCIGALIDYKSYNPNIQINGDYISYENTKDIFTDMGISPGGVPIGMKFDLDPTRPM